MRLSKRLHLVAIEFWWHVEHAKSERIAIIGYRKRKAWEHKYVNKFKENIYGQPL